MYDFFPHLQIYFHNGRMLSSPFQLWLLAAHTMCWERTIYTVGSLATPESLEGGRSFVECQRLPMTD